MNIKLNRGNFQLNQNYRTVTNEVNLPEPAMWDRKKDY
jgi:hypothetical protein